MIIALFGCSLFENKSVYFILSDNGFGLKQDMEVLCNGVSIGDIESVRLNKNKALISFRVDSKFNIPTNGQLYVGSNNFFDKVLNIDYNYDNGIYLVSGDTLMLNLSNNSTLIKDGL